MKKEKQKIFFLTPFRQLLETSLSGWDALHKRNKKVKENIDTVPNDGEIPPEEESSTPGVDPAGDSENLDNIKAKWTIEGNPNPWGGYYVKNRFDNWSENTKKWTKHSSERQKVNFQTNQSLAKKESDYPQLTLTASVNTNQSYSIPAPYNYIPTNIVVKPNNSEFQAEVFISNDGCYSLMVNSNNSQKVEVKVNFGYYLKNIKDEPKKTEFNQNTFTQETLEELAKISKKYPTNLQKATAILLYVRNRCKYLAPKTQQESDQYNTEYRTNPAGFGYSVDELKTGDCDVVNTYFALLCENLGIPVRHVVGDMVKGKNSKNQAITHSGTGHAWSEVWDEKEQKWQRFDATPNCDSNVENEEDTGGSSTPGDYGEQPTVMPTPEEIEKLKKELEKKVKELGKDYPKIKEIMEAGNIEEKEASEILQEMRAAYELTSLTGSKIIDELKKIFEIINSSLKNKPKDDEKGYSKAEGGVEIINGRLVETVIGVRNGELYRATRSLEKAKPEKEEEPYSDLELYLIMDGSGSMGNTAINFKMQSEQLIKIQQKIVYLLLLALHEFKDTQSMAVIFTDNQEIKEAKADTNQFKLKEQVKYWLTTGKSGGGNGDENALRTVFRHINSKIEQETTNSTNKKGKDKPKKVRRLAILLSDGGPTNPQEAKIEAEKFANLPGTELHVIGLTETAENVKTIFNADSNTTNHIATIVEDINLLPLVIAKIFLNNAKTLLPQTDKNQKNIENILTKFNQYL